MKKFLLVSAALTAVSFAPIANAQSNWPVFAGKPEASHPLSIDPARGVLTIAPIVEKTAPAVVDIRVSATSKVPMNPFANDEFFERFFGDRAPNPRGNNDDEDRITQSAGSGVIIDANKGYILTNHHVVNNADKIEVVLHDRREATAELVGSDPATDIALIKINLRGLDDVKMSNSDTVKVGDYVIAIGNAFGIGQTVTTGIVSALGRSTRGRGNSYQDFIQTDAAINKGNSGGALLNSKGELIGINAAILSRSGGSNGIGFAVPTNMISGIMNQLQEYGEVRRGRIGVTIQNITPDMVEAMSLSNRDGALVSSVAEGSPAEKAGIEPGDVIVSFNGHEILDSDDIRNAVGYVERGKRANISYIRDGKRYNSKIKVESAPEKEGTLADNDSRTPSNPANHEAFDGASFSNIPADLVPRSGTDGVIITVVKSGSNAWDAGLRKQDIIRAVNNKKIKNLDDFIAATKDLKKAVALSVQRGRNQIYIAVK